MTNEYDKGFAGVPGDRTDFDYRRGAQDASNLNSGRGGMASPGGGGFQVPDAIGPDVVPGTGSSRGLLQFSTFFAILALMAFAGIHQPSLIASAAAIPAFGVALWIIMAILPGRRATLSKCVGTMFKAVPLSLLAAMAGFAVLSRFPELVEMGPMIVDGAVDPAAELRMRVAWIAIIGGPAVLIFALAISRRHRLSGLLGFILSGLIGAGFASALAVLVYFATEFASRYSF